MVVAQRLNGATTVAATMYLAHMVRHIRSALLWCGTMLAVCVALSPTLHTAYARIVSQVGIRVFVTGGIGGVHRGVEATMDISADLTELGRTPVAVVCAGVKSILDIPRTLEFLVLCVMMLVRWLLLLLPLLLTRSWCHVAIDCAACSTGDTRRDGSHSGRQGVPSLLHRAQRLLVPAHDRLCTGCRQANP